MDKLKAKLLDLFVICNVASSEKFELFCRYLNQLDVDAYEYFDESLADKYDLPNACQFEEGYYDNAHYRFRLIETCTLIDGFKFGVYDSYEEALNAAKAYTAETLLDKFFSVFAEAKAEAEKLVN